MFRRGVRAVEMTPGDLLTRLLDFEGAVVFPIRLHAPPLPEYSSPPKSKTTPVFDFRPANMAAVRSLVETLERYNITPRVIVRVDGEVAFMAYPDVIGVTLVMQDPATAVILRITHRDVHPYA